MSIFEWKKCLCWFDLSVFKVNTLIWLICGPCLTKEMWGPLHLPVMTFHGLLERPRLTEKCWLLGEVQGLESNIKWYLNNCVASNHSPKDYWYTHHCVNEIHYLFFHVALLQIKRNQSIRYLAPKGGGEETSTFKMKSLSVKVCVSMFMIIFFR